MSHTPRKSKGAKNPRMAHPLSEEQKVFEDLYQKFDVNFIIGRAGTGKTFTAIHQSLMSFRKKEIYEIGISRPITKNGLGFLPGDVYDKMKEWVEPIMHNINQCQSHSTTEKMLNSNKLQIKPVDFMKGITFIGSAVIIDEFQDLNYNDFRLVLTRLGRTSKLIFCGDPGQVHHSVADPCFPKIEKIKHSGLVGWLELNENRRNKCIPGIVDYLEN